MRREAMEQARQALDSMFDAWDSLQRVLDDPDVARVLSDRVEVTNVDTGEVTPLYPFGKTLDEMYSDFQEWVWYMTDEIDYELAKDKVMNCFDSLNVRPSTIARIANDVYEEFKNWEG